MLRVKKQPESKGRKKVLDDSDVVIEKIEENVETFPTPNPNIQKFKSDIQNARDKIHALELAEANRKQKAEEVKVAIKTVMDDYSMEATYVEMVANGDKEIVYSAGMIPIIQSNHVVDMPKIKNAHFSNIDGKRKVALAWAMAKRSRGYVVRSTTDITDPNSWQILKICTKSSTIIEDLPSGETMWFTIAAFGAKGEGEPSEPIAKVIP